MRLATPLRHAVDSLFESIGDQHDQDLPTSELIIGVSQRFAAQAAGNNNTPPTGITTNR
jgi:hypothetical protein